MFATMAVHHLFASLILFICNTVFSAEISVFVQTGDSVELYIQTLPEFDDLSWRKDKSEMIVRYTNETKRVKLHPSYKDRVDFNDKTFSLTLKNIQETDSGLYIARVSGETETDIATYRVSVIDAVEAPVLNSKVSSSDSCTVNFTCSAQEFMINSTYQNNRCSPEEVTSQINTLILDCSEESIICNHSNPVSWKEVRMSITQICEEKERPFLHSSGPSYMFVLLIVCVVVGVIGVFAGLILCCKNKRGADDTDYDDVETQKMTGDTWTTVTYCTVGRHHTPSSARDR
ncbi:CD48 antigen [Puntigrus tetrazona]|uniref:CD48 antigen n=1 Tax=Puntigrus tetrazona TaxID=1606681 RepID=UPI001C89C625|nr:CD48 antigen [Puntigrus tetrazona]